MCGRSLIKGEAEIPYRSLFVTKVVFFSLSQFQVGFFVFLSTPDFGSPCELPCEFLRFFYVVNLSLGSEFFIRFTHNSTVPRRIQIHMITLCVCLSVQITLSVCFMSVLFSIYLSLPTTPLNVPQRKPTSPPPNHLCGPRRGHPPQQVRRY